MSLSEEVEKFTSTCETLLAAIDMEQHLTVQEATRIERYCFLILAKIVTRLNNT